MNSDIRVRFAPSPTGYLHVGGLRTALYNYLFARAQGGVFVLRIEDTDRTRLVEGAVENLLRTLSWAGLECDEGPAQGGPFGPYVQSERLELYAAHIQTLLADGKAYRCFCTTERLAELKKAQAAEKRPPMYDRRCRTIPVEEAERRAHEGEACTVRMKVPLLGEVVFTDEIRGEVRVSASVIDDQVLLKSDGYPTYHLANVVDDHLMRISHVIRGEEWLPSTPKHLLLYDFFGWTPPRFAHLPLLLNADRSKLSKRQGDVAVEDFRAKGYLRDALVNFVALLGWNTSDNREMFTLPELVAAFSLARVGKAGAVFDHDKLDWFNAQYLRALPADALAALCTPHLEAAGVDVGDRARTDAVLAAVLSHLTVPADVVEAARIFFEAMPLAEEGEAREALAAPGARVVLESFARLAGDVSPWTRDAVKECIKAVQKDAGVKGKELFMPIRAALTGRAHGPELPVIAELLGRDVCLERILAALR
ncbi:MAG: glutamate--tRNA ligase [Ignavibacteria bacterium]|nr:glutamate--tRNA ligase [Ignavibacteria bacterium]